MIIAPRFRRGRLAASLTVVLVALVFGQPQNIAADSIIHVTTTSQAINSDGECSLPEAIYAANFNDNVAPDPDSVLDPNALIRTGCARGSTDGVDTIALPAFAQFTFSGPLDDYHNFVGPSATPLVTSPILIEGQGAVLQRVGDEYLRAFVVGPTGNLHLREVHVKGFAIHGGNGADGGGGGLGAGGAVYVQAGVLTISHSTFESNSAQGGHGSFQDTFGGGGGGGLSGNGGTANLHGGGGGGARGDGSAPYGPNHRAGSGGGRVTSSALALPGQPCGGEGGDTNSLSSEDGDSATCAGGGGGGGTEREGLDLICGGDGGAGDYGGGGGGAGFDGSGGNGGFGGGGGGGGGDGGFGGGGGSGETCSAFPHSGQGGTFGGDGDGAFGGGGGGGVGGAVFGYLATINIVNSTFAGNWVRRGLSAGDANQGRGAGGAIFTVAGSLTIDSSTIAGNDSGEFTNTGSGPVGIGGGGIVAYKPTTGESTSLLLRNTIVANNGPWECYTRNGVSTAGSTHNLITDNHVNSNGDTPCPGVVASADPQLQGLALNVPGRTMTMKMPLTSPAVDAADPATSPQLDQRLLLRPQGQADDVGAYEASAIPPITTITLDPATPDGSNGWYRNLVAVNVTASDVDGTVDQVRCALNPSSVPSSFEGLPDGACTLTSVGTDGEHRIYAASRDTEGNVEAALALKSFKLDATAPSLSVSLSAPAVMVGQTGVSAVPVASDVTSGVASAECDPVSTATPGVKTLTCTATDSAGNTAIQSLTYVVQYRILGFFSPVPNSQWRTNQVVPIKIALGDVAGTPISDAEAQMLADSCRVTFSASGAQSTEPQCLRYEPRDDQFVYNWMVSRSGIGSVAIEVSVSYPNTSTKTRLTESVEIRR